MIIIQVHVWEYTILIFEACMATRHFGFEYAAMQGRRCNFKQESRFQCIKTVKSAQQIANNNDRKAVRDTLFKSPPTQTVSC